MHVPPSVRYAKNASVNEARRRGHGRGSDQGGVWNDVAAFQTRTGQRTDTGSYLEAAERVDLDLDRIIQGLRPLPGQRGVIVGIAGRVRALELFDRASTFSALFEGLLRGYAADALGAEPVPTSSSAARRMVRRAAGAEIERTAGIGLGEELSADQPGFTLAGLALDDEPVHLVALAG
jgi:hypothetical protein